MLDLCEGVIAIVDKGMAEDEHSRDDGARGGSEERITTTGFRST